MKRFHVHVAVPDLDKSIRFYSTIFGARPSVVKPDYAKWMLEDPRVNFAISVRGNTAGVNHLGFQVDEAAELTQMHGRLQAAGGGVVEEKNVSCCYANSDKYWVTDPAGVAWETFRSLGTVPFYNGAAAAADKADACCAPSEAQEEKATCCS
jgi:catechol 2,3-dioxygenase-like lactoylglutathione lyase family enzyme